MLKTKMLAEKELLKCTKKQIQKFLFLRFQIFMENGLKKIITLYLQLLHTIYLDQKNKNF